MISLLGFSTEWCIGMKREFITRLTKGIPIDPFIEPEGIQRLAVRVRSSQHLFFLFTSGLAKLMLCIPFWALCKIQLVKANEERDERKKLKRKKKARRRGQTAQA